MNLALFCFLWEVSGSTSVPSYSQQPWCLVFNFMPSKAYCLNFSNFLNFFSFPICVSCMNDSLLLCQLPDSATFWVVIEDRRLSSIVTDLGRNRCLLRGSLSTFISWRCKENANERNESMLSNCRVLLFFYKDNTFFGCLFICRMTC